MLAKMDITWKVSLPIPIQWNSKEVILQRQIYVSELRKVIWRPLVFIDEAGFNLHIKKGSRGREVAGYPATLSIVPKGKRVSIIGALTNQGLVHHSLLSNDSKQRGTKAKDFKNFFFDLLRKIPKNSVLILDNAKIHHAEELKSAYATAKEQFGYEIFIFTSLFTFSQSNRTILECLKNRSKE